MKFNDETIQNIFGSEDAESEPIERLREYYLKNDAYIRMNSGLPIRILVGHKGVGKSALMKVAFHEDIEKGYLPIMIRPDDIAELGKDDEDFLLTIRKWKFGLNSVISKKVMEELGLNDDSIKAKLFSYSSKLLTLLTETVSQVKQDNIRFLPSQEKMIDDFLDKKKIIVYIDDLDRGWEGKKEDIKRISALLNCIRDMANESSGLYFRLSLRADVYFLVRTSDESTDKIEGSVVWYSWTNHEILVMLIKRVLTHFQKPVHEEDLLRSPQSSIAYNLDNIIDHQFHGRGKWENVPTFRVLMSLIRKRPRDLVKLCTLAARKAFESNSTSITTSHLLDILSEYSLGRIQDTINEYKSELPGIQRLLFGMKPSSSKAKIGQDNYFYKTAELKLKINNICTMGAFHFSNKKTFPATAQELIQFLYRINFLTAKKVLNNGEIVRKYFEESQYLSSNLVDFGYDWEVHPAYRWALQPDNPYEVASTIPLSNE